MAPKWIHDDWQFCHVIPIHVVRLRKDLPNHGRKLAYVYLPAISWEKSDMKFSYIIGKFGTYHWSPVGADGTQR